jgi:hypothetical protein
VNALKDALRRNPGISKQLRTPGVNATAAASAATVAAGSFHPIDDEIFERFASGDDPDGCAIRSAKSKRALGKSGAGTHLRFGESAANVLAARRAARANSCRQEPVGQQRLPGIGIRCVAANAIRFTGQCRRCGENDGASAHQLGKRGSSPGHRQRRRDGFRLFWAYAAQGAAPSALSSALAANHSLTSRAQPLAASRNRRTASSFAPCRSANSPP